MCEGLWEQKCTPPGHQRKPPRGSDSALAELESARGERRMDREGFSRWRERVMQRLRYLRACGTFRKHGTFGTGGEPSR